MNFRSFVRVTTVILPLCVGTVWVSAAEPASKTASDSAGYLWPQWRGPNQDGVATVDSADVRPTEIAWSMDVPGNGGSTPVIAGSQAFLTSGVEGQNTLMAIDVDSGATNWSVGLGEDRGNKHRKGSGSNPSPVTDGEHVAAYFRSGDLACVRTSGELVWKVNLQSEFGEDTLWWDLGSSPALVDGMVVVAVMQTGPSYLVAYDLATGTMRWKADRMTDAPQEAAQSYSTPLSFELDGKSMIAVLGADCVTLHRAADGVEVARLGGFNPDGEKYFRSIASPVIADAGADPIMICPYARGATLTAVNLAKLAGGAGNDSIAWMRDDLGSDVPTPAAIGETAIVVTDAKRTKGTVYGLDIRSGQTRWNASLPRTRNSYSASPLILGGAAYVINEEAKLSVLSPLDSDPSVVHSQDLDDEQLFTVASPVPTAGGDLLIRTRRTLKRLSKP